MQILFLCGNESNHNYFIDQIISNTSIEKYTIIKVHSGIPNIEYYMNIFKKENMSSVEYEYLLNFINERNQAFDKYHSMIFQDEHIVKNSVELNHLLNDITDNNYFDLYLAYGVPIIENKVILDDQTKSVNLHFGLSRYYRGADTNIYALAHNEPDKVGVTAHKLAKKVDSGAVLFEVVLSEENLKKFSSINSINAQLLMLSVSNLVDVIKNNAWSFEKKTYTESPLILDSMVKIDSIIQAESNLRSLQKDSLQQ